MLQAGGLIAVVYPETHGVVVVVDAAIAATALQVRDASDLVGYPDALLQLPTGPLVGYDGFSFATDTTGPDTVTLTAGLTAGLTAEVELDLWQADVDGTPIPVVTYWATVMFDDGSQGDALVDTAWVTHLQVGIRGEGRRERVLCERETDLDTWVLRRPIRRPPRLDLSSARLGSLDPGAVAPGMFTGDFELDGTLKLGAGSALVDSAGMPIVDGLDSGSLPSAFATLTTEVADLAALVLALPGATPDDDMYVDELTGDIYFVAT